MAGEKFNRQKYKYKLSPGDIELINLRLIKAREYCPSEFARQPDPLTNLGSYKATQYISCTLVVPWCGSFLGNRKRNPAETLLSACR